MAAAEKSTKNFETSAAGGVKSPDTKQPATSEGEARNSVGPESAKGPRKAGERLCKVHRRGENQNAPITATPGDIRRKKEFWPGQPVYLTDRHIAVLRDAVIDSEIPIPDNSGIYDAANPQFEAQKRNPGYEAKVDVQTGSVYLKKIEPLYIVEIIE